MEKMLQLLETKYKKDNATKIAKILEKLDEKERYEKLGQIMVCDKKNINQVLKNKFFDNYENNIDNKISTYINKPEVQEGNYQCNKCGSKRTYFYQVQTRSADEAMTTFVTCANPRCQTRWKE